MGNAAERVEKAVQQLNQLTQSAAFSSVMNYRMQFKRVGKPLAVEMSIMEPDCPEVGKG